MYEKVNPSHPDKLADRIAGALVDVAYSRAQDPRIAVEVLLGHGACNVIAETSVEVGLDAVTDAVRRIAGPLAVRYVEVPQDERLAGNQAGGVRCGDNGIFRGCPVTDEQRRLAAFMRDLYELHPCDGKAVADGGMLTLCQSNAGFDELALQIGGYDVYAINPLGDWEGGPDVDCGATNRKLGSDMGDAVTGGGLHGKDLSKADVSVNVACHMLAQVRGTEVSACCAIGDELVTFRFGDSPDLPVMTLDYGQVTRMAGEHIRSLGGFEALAEWGLVR